MEEAIYDTSAVIELVARRRQRIPGYVSALTVVEYPPVLRFVDEVLYPRKKDYLLATKWQTELRRIGTPLPAVDLVIAAQAYNEDLVLVTLDKHFKLLKQLVAPGLEIRDAIPNQYS